MIFCVSEKVRGNSNLKLVFEIQKGKYEEIYLEYVFTSGCRTAL